MNAFVHKPYNWLFPATGALFVMSPKLLIKAVLKIIKFSLPHPWKFLQKPGVPTPCEFGTLGRWSAAPHSICAKFKFSDIARENCFRIFSCRKSGLRWFSSFFKLKSLTSSWQIGQTASSSSSSRLWSGLSIFFSSELLNFFLFSFECACKYCFFYLLSSCKIENLPVGLIWEITWENVGYFGIYVALLS